jgi:SAM-dependent methyltransferase
MSSPPKRHSPRRLLRESIADYAVRDAVLRHAPALRGCVLDLGSGDRRHESLLNGQVQRWVALDWPAPGDSRADAADVHGDAAAVPFAAESFDGVLCTQVLEHVAEPQRIFEEIRRVLRPGGRLLLTAPQYNALHEEPRDFFRYTRYGLQHLAEKAGFRVERVEPIGGFIALFAFLTTIHFAPLRWQPLFGIWQWSAWQLDRALPRPKDCMGYVMVAVRETRD